MISRNSNIENQLKEHERLLRYFLRKKFGPVVPEDVESAGRIGLLFAVQGYKLDKGPFVPYAARCIIGYALREMRKARLIKTPTAEYLKPVSLNKPLDDSNETLQDTISYPAENEDLKELVSEAIQNLKHKEKKIIYGYFWKGYSLTEISEKMNVTPQRIQRIKEDALKKLKKEIRL